MAGVFVFKDAKTLVPMQPAEFAAEADFQQLLAEFPELLSGDQIDTASPRRWLFVSRETTIPSQEDGGALWAVDHLFLDQDSIPTLVEVKRQSDYRLRRREVVGQMLDYAANAVRYWPTGRIRGEFEATCKIQNKDPELTIRNCLHFHDGSIETFWNKVEKNLGEGKIRLLFVADHIPDELKNIVEFLNQQMDRTEVLALELRLYEGEGGLKTLVPIIYGQTQEAQQKKGVVSAIGTEELFRQLETKQSGLGEKLQAFIEEMKPAGVFLERTPTTLKLAGRANERLWPLSSIDKWGNVWLDGMLGKAKSADRYEAGLKLYRALVELIDDQNLRAEKLAPGTKSGIGSLPLSLLLQKSGQWASAVEQYLRSVSAKPEAKSEVIIEIGADGGSVTLYGLRTKRGWFFSREVIDSGWALMDEGPTIQHNSAVVDSWEAALELLDQYPWATLYPISIHPDFRQRIWAAVQERLHSPAEFSSEVKRWRQFCNAH